MTIRRNAILTILGLTTLLAVACSSAAPATPETAASLPEPTVTASLPPATEAPAEEALPTAIIPATSPPLGADAPLEISGFELIALETGLATYSGHSCLYTPAGCACELPELVQSQFELDDENDQMFFTLVGDGYQTRWTMTHIGVNKWIKSEPIMSAANGDQVGEARVLLSFDEEGYVITYLFDNFETGIVTCPDVNFSQVSGG